MNYNQVVEYLESLTMMPKSMPGLEKIRSAVTKQSWFSKIDPQKVITVAGTNGKGTTAASLETLLVSANQKVGLYTSPHLISTTERIRFAGKDISEAAFIVLFLKHQAVIKADELSHFESLTLMAADYFFTQDHDFIIFEVGLGGLFDATNIFPNHYSVITKLGFDHENILGHHLIDIARNKFGIIKQDSVVIHHRLDPQLNDLIAETQKRTKSHWVEARMRAKPFKTNLVGPRAQENISNAVTVFENLGFDFESHQHVLSQINWPGRMQQVRWPGIRCPLFLSGDHNPQGIESLMVIIDELKYKNLYLIIGIGVDKAAETMLQQILTLPRIKLCLTETLFKGLQTSSYPVFARRKAQIIKPRVEMILNEIKPEENDLVIVTGSLYLIGAVLKMLERK